MQRIIVVLAAALVLSGCSASGGGGPSAGPPSGSASISAAPTRSSPADANSTARSHGPAGATAVPQFAHVVVVVEENHASSQIVGDAQAPYLNALARSGVNLTNSYGIRHPSQPNYLALFSGSTHGLTDDSCPHTYTGDNLGHQLRARGLSFTGYSDALPSTGYRGCTDGPYARKHAPWVDFANLPGSVNRPMSAFPSAYSSLPRLAFVIPDLDHDMHDGTVAQADQWLKTRLGGYATWARTHNSLLVVTWDEDDNTPRNKIPGMIVGAHVKPMRYGGRVDHYTMLRTLEAAFGLPALGAARDRAPITAIWTH